MSFSGNESEDQSKPVNDNPKNNKIIRLVRTKVILIILYLNNPLRVVIYFSKNSKTESVIYFNCSSSNSVCIGKEIT